MAFRTKVDYSSNRQIKQFPETFTVLSGGTGFGLPFSALTKGPDLTTSGVSYSITNVVSTFSGNSSISIYTWYNSAMQLGASSLSAIVPTNTAVTQTVSAVYTASSTTVIDGNTVALAYTGVSFDITPIGFTSLGGGAYSGTVVSSYLNILSAGTLDFTGRTIWVDVSGITRTDSLIVKNDATFSNIGSLPSAGSLHYTSAGVLTTNTSDKRLKTNITPITDALSKVLSLKGVYYNWTNEPDTNKRIGFIAQDVASAVPELAFTNERSEEKYMGVHYDNVTSLLVEAVKELVDGKNINSNIHTKTETIIAEDNNIELNFNGSKDTAVGGGITVMNIPNGTNGELNIDDQGNWVTNNPFKPKWFVLPTYTPSSSNDNFGSDGFMCKDDNYIYIKTGKIFKRFGLESF